MLIVRSPLRISFAGGGTDLPSYFEAFGGAVLSAAINKYFYTIVGKRTDGRMQIISSDLKVCETWNDINRIGVKESGSALQIPLAVVKELGCPAAVDLFLASEIPPGTGLGSSASVCVNVLQALASYLNISLLKHELAEKAFHIARNVLGKPVGKQDEFAAAFGGLNFFTFNTDGTTAVEPVNPRPEVMSGLQRRLMLFFTGTARDSWSILQEQEALTREPGGAAVESLHRIRELAVRMRRTLVEGNLRSFGSLLHEGWENKKKICARISNSTIDRLYSLAQESGAVGGKITGAGGGGFLLLYCEEENQQAVRDALTAEGILEMKFAFDFVGSRVLVNDPFIDQAESCAAQVKLIPLDRQEPWSRKQI